MKKIILVLAFSFLGSSNPAVAETSSIPKFVSSDDFRCFRFEQWQDGTLGDGLQNLSSSGLKFNKSAWDKPQHRQNMLFDLTHNYELKGQSREEINKLIGDPVSFSTKYPFDDITNENTEWHYLSFSWCANAPRNYLVFLYANGRVIAYREVRSALLTNSEFERLSAKDPHWHKKVDI